MHVKWTSSELKELILGALAFLWGILLLIFPENSLAPYGTYTLHQFYEADWLWGLYLAACGLIILFSAAGGYRELRKIVHASLWMFWIGIGIVILIRTYPNGVSATDVLIILPFVAIAFLHAVIYTRLAVK